MSLHPKEAHLIKLIRERFQWGDVLIETKEGLPFRMKKASSWTIITDEIPSDLSTEG